MYLGKEDMSIFLINFMIISILPLIVSEISSLSLDEMPGSGHLLHGDHAGVRLQLGRGLHLGGLLAQRDLDPVREVGLLRQLETVLALHNLLALGPHLLLHARHVLLVELLQLHQN